MLLCAMKGEFGKKEYSGSFTLRAVEEHRVVDGQRQRVVSEPANANRWLWHQGSLPASGVVAALQFYSDKTQLNRKGTAAHPLRLSLLNVGYAARMQMQNLRNVGYMPIIQRPHGMSVGNYKALKHVVRQRCLSILLEPLKRLSHEGIQLKDPDGHVHLVFPRLISIVGDHPEICDLMGIFSAGMLQMLHKF